MNLYCGESLAKKVVRVRTYRRVLEALKWQGVKPAQSKVVFLPGPDACEVGVLRHMLGVQAEQVVAVDRDAAALATVRARWPGVRTLQGDLGDLRVFDTAAKLLETRSAPPAHFVHMDLMGNLSKGALHLYPTWAQLVATNGVFVVTYLRGREMPGSVGAESRKMFEAVRDGLPVLSHAEQVQPEVWHIPKVLRHVLDADFARAFSHWFGINFQLDDSGRAVGIYDHNWLVRRLKGEERRGVYDPSVPFDLFAPLGTHCYKSKNSPMGVLITQRVEEHISTSASYVHLQAMHGRNVTSIIAQDPMSEILAEADSLLKTYTRPEVEEILNLKPGQLAAWRAHATRRTPGYV